MAGWQNIYLSKFGATTLNCRRERRKRDVDSVKLAVPSGCGQPLINYWPMAWPEPLLCLPCALSPQIASTLISPPSSQFSPSSLCACQPRHRLQDIVSTNGTDGEPKNPLCASLSIPSSPSFSEVDDPQSFQWFFSYLSFPVFLDTQNTHGRFWRTGIYFSLGEGVCVVGLWRNPTFILVNNKCWTDFCERLCLN